MGYFYKYKAHYIIKEHNGKQYDIDGNVICVWNDVDKWWEPLYQYRYDTIDYTRLPSIFKKKIKNMENRKIVSIKFELSVVDINQNRVVGYESWSIDGFNTADKHWSYTRPDIEGSGVSGSCNIPIYHNRKRIVNITYEDEIDIEERERQRLRMVGTIDMAREIRDILS